MKTLNRPFFGLVLLIALCLGLNDDSFAVSFSLKSVDATWGNLQPADPKPPFNIRGNPAFFNTSQEFKRDGVLIRSIARWGEPATENGPQSGLDYVPPKLGPIPTNAEHPFGTLKHINNPVFDPGAKLADLLLNLEIAEIADEKEKLLDVPPIKLTFGIDETPNVFGGDDIITLEEITIGIDDGKGLKLLIKGFRSAGSTETLPNFTTSEDERNAGEVFGKITLPDEPPTSTVPEPSTILLLGSGLAGLAAWWRFRGKHRTN